MDIGSDPASSFVGLAILLVLGAFCLVLQFRRPRVFVKRFLRWVIAKAHDGGGFSRIIDIRRC